jgi:ParB/RepB/Spo0J family partition protein
VTVRELRVDYQEIPTQLIDEPVTPSRSKMEDEPLDELASDMRENGQLVPISVARVGERFEVIAGHRRRLAAGRVGLPVMRCLVYASKSDALERIKFAENFYREDLSPAEEAAYFQELLELKCGGDTNALTELLGLKRSFIENRLLLFQGAPEVFHALEEKKIGIGVAHALNRIDEKMMRDHYLKMAILGGATEHMVRRWVDDWASSRGPAREEGDAPAPAAAPAPVVQTNFFTCYVCGGSHDVHEMQPVNIHTSCRKAILDPALGKLPPSTP